MQLMFSAAEATPAGIVPDLRLGPDDLAMLTRGGMVVSPVPEEGRAGGSVG